METSPKSNVSVYLICTIGGIFGFHRFYVGKILTGLIQFFTFGGLFIWWGIDLYRIIKERFKDNKGGIIKWPQPERIGGAHNYAGFWVRAAAFSIDGLVVGLFLIPVIIIVLAFSIASGLEGEELKNTIDLYYNGASYTISTIYYVYHHSSAKQATIGKKIVGIYVVNASGERLSIAHSIGRTFATLLSFITMYIGFMMAGWTKKKQALHDIVAGTYVVYGKPEDGVIKP